MSDEPERKHTDVTEAPIRYRCDSCGRGVPRDSLGTLHLLRRSGTTVMHVCRECREEK